MLSGNCFRLLQSANTSRVKTGAGNPPLGNETNLGHSQISRERGEVRSLRGLSWAHSDLRSGHSEIEREFNVGNKSSGMHLRVAAPLILTLENPICPISLSRESWMLHPETSRESNPCGSSSACYVLRVMSVTIPCKHQLIKVLSTFQICLTSFVHVFSSVTIKKYCC